jgi:hypothetical protein
MERVMIPFSLPKNNTSGFYKLNTNNTLTLKREVEELGLNTENHQQHQYPVNDWYWFDGEHHARSFFDLPQAEIIPEIINPYLEIDPLILKPHLVPTYNKGQ